MSNESSEDICELKKKDFASLISVNKNKSNSIRIPRTNPGAILYAFYKHFCFNITIVWPNCFSSFTSTFYTNGTIEGAARVKRGGERKIQLIQAN